MVNSQWRVGLWRNWTQLIGAGISGEVEVFSRGSAVPQLTAAGRCRDGIDSLGGRGICSQSHLVLSETFSQLAADWNGNYGKNCSKIMRIMWTFSVKGVCVCESFASALYQEPWPQGLPVACCARNATTAVVCDVRTLRVSSEVIVWLFSIIYEKEKGKRLKYLQ